MQVTAQTSERSIANAIPSVSVPFSSLDTSSANGLTTVTFPNPVTIPSNKVFYAGIGLTYSGSDAVGLLTTTDGDFPAAITHTWEEWSDNGFYSLGSTNSFGLDVAYAIFPVVEINAPTPPQPELVYYSQNFDAGIPSTYSIIDVDGNTVNTAVAGIIKKAWSSAMSTSWYTPAGASDDWMITEAIVIPDTARVIATIKNGTNVIYADTLLLTSGLPSANTEIEFTMNKLFDAPSAAGSYNLTLTSEVSISASEDLSNNTLESVVGKYSISDTTYSRDDNATGTTSLSIGGGLTGHLGMVYDIVSRDTLTSVTAVLRGVARAGRTASVSVWEYNNAPASAPLATSKVYNASAPGTYNFILSGGVDLTPGKYLVTIDELDSTINSATINEYAVTITDMLGRVVESHTGLPNGEFNFDLSNQPNGMYFVRVNSGDAVTSLKLVLNK